MDPTITTSAMGASSLDTKKVTKFPFVSTRCVWHTAAQKCRQNNSHTVGRSSQWDSCILLYGVDIWGPLFFGVTLVDREGDKEKEINIDSDRERYLNMEI